MGIILPSRGSAPGMDGVPYELDHYGVAYGARLLQEALWAGSQIMGGIESLIGPRRLPNTGLTTTTATIYGTRSSD